MSDIAKPIAVLPPLPLSSRPPGLWNGWLTLAWGTGALVVLCVVQVALLLGCMLAGLLPLHEIMVNPKSLELNAAFLGIAELVCAPVVVGYFAFAARAAGVPVSEYLGLKWPRLKHIVVGLALVFGVLTGFDLLSAAIGEPVTSSFMNDVLTSAQRDSFTMALLIAAVTFLAPLQEEIAFRGFLLPGFASQWGLPVALIITSAIWASLHVQYGWFVIAQIFAIGMVIGWLRWWSGSTILTILVHCAVNTVATVETWVLR